MQVATPKIPYLQMNTRMKPKNYKRGYPVATLVGVENDHAALWQVYSQVAKHQQNITLNGDRNDPKVVYNFHEAIVNALRPTLKEGVTKRNSCVSSKNHLWARIPKSHKSPSFLALPKRNKTVFSTITGSASTPSQVACIN